MNDNKKFWQRYAPIYATFMKNTDKSYDKICEKVKPYISHEMHVLELACGSGQLSFRLAACAKTWEATDFSENMVREAKNIQKDKKAQQCKKVMEGLRFSVQDATSLPYEAESFDAVMIANALHIMPNPEKALAEIKRVLKPDGVLLAPTFVHGEGAGFAIRSGLLELFGFRTFMKPTNEEFVRFIEKNGFRVIEHDGIGSKVAPLCCLIAKK